MQQVGKIITAIEASQMDEIQAASLSKRKVKKQKHFIHFKCSCMLFRGKYHSEVYLKTSHMTYQSCEIKSPRDPLIFANASKEPTASLFLLVRDRTKRCDLWSASFQMYHLQIR